MVRARRAVRKAAGPKELPYTRETCLRKRRYFPESKAERAAERMEVKDPAHRFGHYRCRYCGDYHVGKEWEPNGAKL